MLRRDRTAVPRVGGAGATVIHQGQPLPLSVAIGFTVIEQGDTAEAVLDRADQEMYRDKAAA